MGEAMEFERNCENRMKTLITETFIRRKNSLYFFLPRYQPMRSFCVGFGYGDVLGDNGDWRLYNRHRIKRTEFNKKRNNMFITKKIFFTPRKKTIETFWTKILLIRIFLNQTINKEYFYSI